MLYVSCTSFVFNLSEKLLYFELMLFKKKIYVSFLLPCTCSVVVTYYTVMTCLLVGLILCIPCDEP